MAALNEVAQSVDGDDDDIYRLLSADAVEAIRLSIRHELQRSGETRTALAASVGMSTHDVHHLGAPTLGEDVRGSDGEAWSRLKMVCFQHLLQRTRNDGSRERSVTQAFMSPHRVPTTATESPTADVLLLDGDLDDLWGQMDGEGSCVLRWPNTETQQEQEEVAEALSIIEACTVHASSSCAVDLDLEHHRSFMAALATALAHRPDHLTHAPHPHLEALTRCLVCALGAMMDDTATRTCLRYFSVVEPLEKLGLLQLLLRTLLSWASPQQSGDSLLLAQDDENAAFYLMNVALACARELPDHWTSLMDEEVEQVFHEMLRVVTHDRLYVVCGRGDGQYAWIHEWSSRPCVSRAISEVATPTLEHISTLLLHDASALAMCSLMLPTWAGSVRNRIVGGENEPARSAFIAQMPSQLISATLDRFMRGESIQEEVLSMIHQSVEQSLDVITDEGSVELAQLLLSATVAVVAESSRGSHRTSTMSWLLRTLASVVGKLSVEGEKEEEEILQHPSASRVKIILTAMDSELSTLLEARPHLALAAHPFYRSILSTSAGPRLPRTLNQLEGGLLQRRQDVRPFYSIHHLVALSSSREGWRLVDEMMLRSTCAASPSSFFDELLIALLLPASGELFPFASGLEVEEKFSDVFVRDAGTEVFHEPLQLSTDGMTRLMRWSINKVACAGLYAAATRGMKRVAARHHMWSYTSPTLMEWPLLLPVEMYSEHTRAPLPLERTPVEDRLIALMALYQSVGLLLGILSTVHANNPAEDGGASFSLAVQQQVARLWLEDINMPSSTDGHMVYGDDSLVLLLALLVLCGVFGDEVGGAVVEPDFARKLAELCEGRCGVDPVCLLAVTLTKGEEEHKLQAWDVLRLMLHGLEAEVDDACLTAARSNNSSGITILVENEEGDLNSTSGENHRCRVARRLTATEFEEVEHTMQQRSEQEWGSFCHDEKRTRGVVECIVAHHRSTYHTLQMAGVDVDCFVRWWLRSGWRHKHPSRRMWFEASVQKFVVKTLSEWEAWVAAEVAHHVEAAQLALQRLDGALCSGAWSTPTCTAIPFATPLSLFVFLLPYGRPSG